MSHRLALLHELTQRRRSLLAGTRALVDAGYPAKLVDKAVNETEQLQPLALKVRDA